MSCVLSSATSTSLAKFHFLVVVFDKGALQIIHSFPPVEFKWAVNGEARESSSQMGDIVWLGVVIYALVPGQ